MSKKVSSIEFALEKLVEAADEKKGFNIRSYNVSDRSTITDYVVIVSAKNGIHCRALASEVADISAQIANENPVDFFKTPKRSGTVESGWLIMDLNSILVHLILDDLREFYALDKLFEDVGVVVHH